MGVMCPDRQILSVYFDGELDSPWKEKLENHLAGCPSCRKHLAVYQFTRQRLADHPASLEQAMERIWDNTNFTAKPRRIPATVRRFWNGSITIPLPVAAAAGLVMVLAMSVLIALRQPVKAVEPQLAGLEMQEMTPASDMASLLQYLGSDNSGDMVIIRLPDTTFKRTGEPRMLRAADYQNADYQGDYSRQRRGRGSR